MQKPELTPEQMNALPESTPLEVMKAIVDNGGPVWAVVWDNCARRIASVIGAEITDNDSKPFISKDGGWVPHCALIPAVLPEITRPMTWGDAWDMELWVKINSGHITKASKFVELINAPVEPDDCFMVSTSHRGPWYPPVMPVGRELSGAEWMEWSKAREGGK